ncbi:MAG: hypothetical protein JWN86_4359 [Planctomycetota bacterium]|nr:hypothetical protein [Planctomycetota bacterium]
MNRRMALALTLLSGGLIPATLLAQDPDDLDAAPPRRKKPLAKKAATDRSLDDDPPAAEPPAASGDDTTLPPDTRPEAGYTSQTWNISRYTTLAYTPENPHPEAKIIDWIFRRTGSADWHGEKVAILSASRNVIKAYHSPKMLKQVDQVVRRFTKAVADRLSIRVRFVRAADTRWRYLVHHRMTSLGTGPQGQQIWTLSTADAAQVQAQMQVYRGYEVLVDKTLKLVNGQTLLVEKSEQVGFIAGAERDGAAGLGFQPATQQLKEGVTLRLSPLLTYDGDALDLAIDLQTNIVRRLIKTSILTRREIGPNDMQINVPEVSETRLNQPITNWPLGQTLVISAGVTPGILEPKNGFFRVPGTMPSDRELLVILDAEVTSEAPRTTRRDDEDAPRSARARQIDRE